MDNLKDTFSNVTKNVLKTSKGLIKTTKLSMDLSSEESKLKDIYTELGKKVHEIYTYGGTLGKFFDEKYKELLECERKIDELRKELDMAKGTKTCPKCGKSSAVTSEFCPKCGSRLTESPESSSFPIDARIYEERPQPPPNHTYSTNPPYAPPPPPPMPIYPDEPPVEVDIPDKYYDTSPRPSSEYSEPKPLSASKPCPICGKENPSENKFCYSCGRFL